MNNKDNYKKALDEIHASEDLKFKTFEKIRNTKKVKNNIYFKILAIAAVFIICLTLGIIYEKNNITNLANKNDENSTIQISKVNNDLPRFSSLEELEDVVKQNSFNTRKNMDINKELAFEESIADTNIAKSDNSFASQNENSKDYSTTNIQTENVDEADVVKTDGEYIYYVANSKVYIIKDNLEVISEVEFSNNTKEIFYPKEIYINKNKMIVLGNYSSYTTIKEQENPNQENPDESVYLETEDVVRKESSVENLMISQTQMAKAIVYNIENKKNPEIIREVGLDGYYVNSRMVGNNVYFISNKTPLWREIYRGEEILPLTIDTNRENQVKKINYNEIAYFKDTDSHSYMIVGGFNINNNEEISTETFFGASDTVYASEQNLYITQNKYGETIDKTVIYKFNLNNAQIVLQAQGEVEGYLNNQFSMDEYNGNLRIATTVITVSAPQEEVIDEETKTVAVTLGTVQNETSSLTILDENLKEIGKISDLAPDEKIYSVRFMGDIGYVVTFKEIDPLFVIDLSDPTNPNVKGELKIPGYSSYLHPYDESHIIGIGYNTKENKYGGIVNTNMKVSMFDVSDLENPQEMFSVDVGDMSVHSLIDYEHKVLFYNKDKNLIGFPINYTKADSLEYVNSFVILKIDLENGFEKYGEIKMDIDTIGIERAIYIEDVLYALSQKTIDSYDLNSLEKINTLELD